jgi:hypothetical protein
LKSLRAVLRFDRLRGLSLKTLDAIHVASLVTFQTASGKGIPFITGDGWQRDAATQLGLNVIWVG